MVYQETVGMDELEVAPTIEADESFVRKEAEGAPAAADDSIQFV